jgi:hypothetical protein
MLFVLKNKNLLLQIMIPAIYRPDSNNLYPPISSVTLYQKGVYYSGIKLFNKLQSELKRAPVVA